MKNFYFAVFLLLIFLLGFCCGNVFQLKFNPLLNP